MAKPVIVSDHGGQRETVVSGETGWRFTPGNANALANAIHAFLNKSSETRAQLGMAGRNLVLSKFTKAKLQAATLDVYARLLNKEVLA